MCYEKICRIHKKTSLPQSFFGVFLQEFERTPFLQSSTERLLLIIAVSIVAKFRFPVGDKSRYLVITFRRYLTIILKTSVIRFTYIESEFWSSFDIMSDSEGKDILFLQLVVLFKMKKKKRRKRKIWVRELFRKYASGLWMSEKTYFLEILKYNKQVEGWYLY